VADWLLDGLGAVAARPGAAADLTPRLVDPRPSGRFGAGLPSGTLDYCTGVALALGALAGRPASGVAVAIQVRLPEVMAASYGSSFEMRPAPPRPAPGGGWVHADMGSRGDRESLERLLEVLGPSAAAGEVARAAQEWRLPVGDYRPRSASGAGHPLRFGPGKVTAGAWVGPLRVLDLTNMWAGPLATWLLRDLGAQITKVEPAFRPDGFRAFDGGGIHPGGHPCDPGRDSALWNALNAGKDVVDLDLRMAADRSRFVELAAASDVVIDSFSPRVMPNFGLDLPEGPLYASMPAFPPGPERDWVAYGTAVHAVSGLGDAGDGRFVPAAVSYPDPVAGFTAALGVLAAAAGRARGRGVGRVEGAIAASIQPITARSPDPDRLLADPAGIGADLLALGEERGLLEGRPVCGRSALHPRTVFPDNQNVF
jgi:hypothetical protein